MKRIAMLLTLAVLDIATQAQAQFKNTSPTVPTEFPAFLECGTIRLNPPETSSDPIYKILIFPKFDGNIFESLDITHYSVSGNEYKRSDQYKNASLKQVPSHLEIIWSGTWKKNAAVSMFGRFWNPLGTDKWFYSETQTKYGRVQMEMLSLCHAVQGD
jgi:hypothetical protein